VAAEQKRTPCTGKSVKQHSNRRRNLNTFWSGTRIRDPQTETNLAIHKLNRDKLHP
jgi:hypothetical protein